VNPRKIAVLALAVISVLLMWKDKQADEAKRTAIVTEPKEVA
jgi:hypothetical protein